jgi:hypothetical protein
VAPATAAGCRRHLRRRCAARRGAKRHTQHGVGVARQRVAQELARGPRPTTAALPEPAASRSRIGCPPLPARRRGRPGWIGLPTLRRDETRWRRWPTRRWVEPPLRSRRRADRPPCRGARLDVPPPARPHNEDDGNRDHSNPKHHCASQIGQPVNQLRSMVSVLGIHRSTRQVWAERRIADVDAV